MIIRSSNISDSRAIYELILEKAEFDRSMGAFNGQVNNSVVKIEETLFCSRPYAKVLLAELGQVPVGFAFYHFRFSSFSGSPSIWLDDLYVIPSQRSMGIGAKLIQSLKEESLIHKCSHIGWTASPNNVRGMAFYERIGAIVERYERKRPYYRLNVSTD